MARLRQALLAAFVLAAPWSVAQPNPETAVPSAGAAELILINDSGPTLLPRSQVVVDNGVALPALPRNTYTRLPLAPGRHVLHTDPHYRNVEVVITAAPGARHFVVVAYRPERSWAFPSPGAPLLLKEISEDEAALVLRDMEQR